MGKKKVAVFVSTVVALVALAVGVRAEEAGKTLTFFEDVPRGTTSTIDLGVKGDSQGDLIIWNEPLLDKAKKKIGVSNGFCVRTAPGFRECQWTLSMSDGSITMTGTEADKGTSKVAVAGGAGVYAGAGGECAATLNADGTYTLVVTLKKRKH